MTHHRIAVVQAGLRSPSSSRLLADRLGAAVRRALGDAGHGSAITHVELRDLAYDVTDALLTGLLSPALRSAIDGVSRAGALVAVTPTYTGSYSGLFKSFVDVVEPGTWRGLPVLIAATGGSVRHSLMVEHAMRPLFVSLGAEPVPTGVYATGADLRGGPADALAGRVDRAARDLVRVLDGARVVDLPRPGPPSRVPRAAPPRLAGSTALGG